MMLMMHKTPSWPVVNNNKLLWLIAIELTLPVLTLNDKFSRLIGNQELYA
jgi:hypothetical protein